MNRIILASSSPRRKELLSQLIGNNFEIINSKYEENNNLQFSPSKLVKEHAYGKARDVANKLENGIVIGCDTLVFYESHVLGKPKTVEKTKEMLIMLSGKEIKVLSGICMIDTKKNIVLIESVVTKLNVKILSKEEIENYVKFESPSDKAGGFGIQDRGATFIEKINGDYNNIVGLPLFKLNEMFKELGVDIYDFKK